MAGVALSRAYGVEPIDPIEPPKRLSMSALKHADSCMRSAYFYLRGDSSPAQPLALGTAGHAVLERMMRELLERGEQSFVSPVPGEDEAAAKRDVASFTAQVVDEVARAHPELNLTAHQRDVLRQVAFHWAVGYDVAPGRVLAVEQKFVMEVAGWAVSGILDVIAAKPAQIDDYKITFALPKQEAFEQGFQLPVYAALFMHGQPVSKARCPNCGGEGVIGIGGASFDPPKVPMGLPGPCERCEGSGGVEVLDPPLGSSVQAVRAREVYPRYLTDDGSLLYRERTITRTQVADFLADLEALVDRVDHALKSNVWPAMPGTHCSRCPARAECPIPQNLLTGYINPEAESAEDLAVYHKFLEEAASDLRDVLKEHAEDHGPIQCGADEVWDFEVQPRREVDRAGLEEATRAGRVVSVEDFTKTSYSTTFKRRKAA